MKHFLCLALLLNLLWSPVVWAASLQYVLPGSTTTFQDTGGTTLAFNGTANGAGKYSTMVDKGAGAQPAQYVWVCTISLSGTSVVGNVTEIYVAWSVDGATLDGGIGTTAGSLATADKRRDLKRVGTVVNDVAGSNQVFTATGPAYIPTRYYSVAFWNSSGLSLTATNNSSSCKFTPHPFQMQ